MCRARRRPTDDTGASLIIAIAFMTFLGLVVSSVLTYTGTSLRSTKSTEVKAQSTYDIDGALQAAVNKVRTDDDPDFFTNTPGQMCPGLSSPEPNFRGLNRDADIAVTCTAGAGTGGAGGTVEINPNNRPANALLTLGAGSEIGVDKGSNNVLIVQGGVHVNSTPTSIRQSGGACPPTSLPPLLTSCSGVWVQGGNLVARGSCSGTVVVSPPFTKSCSPANPIAADPAYAPPAGALVYKPVPSCSAGPTLTFEPGYYDDAVALSALTTGAACTGKTLWFKPGVYYFDFHNGEGPALPAAPHVWTIDDPNTEVVGGTPLGWTPALGNPIIPGSCVSPLASAANGGVEFVFGGDSRLDVKAGKIELCGRYSTTRPPIALYGARTGANPAEITATAKTTGSRSFSGPPYADVSKIIEQDDDPATSVIDASVSAVPVKASITLAGFVPPVSVPAGSLVTSAKLMVNHRDNNEAGSALSDLRVQVTPSRAGAPTIDAPVPPFTDGPSGGSYHLEPVDLSALADEVHKHGLTGLDVIYEATVPKGQKVTENLDSIQLVLTWKPPAVRGQATPINGVANCIGTVGAAGCPMIKTVSPNTRLYVHGTTYAPLAKLDLRITNVSIQVFSVGIVLRALAVQITASAALGSLSMINVPPLATGGPVTPLQVYFRAYTCPAGGCGAIVPGPGWKLSGTARAKYENLGAQGYDKVTVLSWTVRAT